MKTGAKVLISLAVVGTVSAGAYFLFFKKQKVSTTNLVKPSEESNDNSEVTVKTQPDTELSFSVPADANEPFVPINEAEAMPNVLKNALIRYDGVEVLPSVLKKAVVRYDPVEPVAQAPVYQEPVYVAPVYTTPVYYPTTQIENGYGYSLRSDQFQQMEMQM